MRKIFVHKEEYIAEIIDAIISNPDREFVLVIPKGAALKEAASNFELLAREVTGAGKRVLIESVDEDILKLAREAGIESAHPLFHKTAGNFSDIVPMKSEEVMVDPTTPVTRSSKKIKIEKIPEGVGKTSPERGYFKDKPDESEYDVDEGSEEGMAMRKQRRWKRRAALLIFGIIILLIAGFFITNAYLGKATITIRLKKTPWSYESQFTVDKSVAHFDVDHHTLPGELFRQDKNIVQTFPATNNQDVSFKAKGKIVIYNAYGKDAQSFVATTRFTTSDGKVFRLVKGVTVPGAEVKDGKVIPSSIEADIVADQAGPSYNIQSAEKLQIPGFANSPKYNGFYGSIKQPITGGFIGKRAVPTKDDIASANNKMNDILGVALGNTLTMNVPTEFKIIEAGVVTKVTKKTVNEQTDADGNFNIFGEAAAQALGFHEGDLNDYFAVVSRNDKPRTVMKDLKIDYGSVKTDLDHGKMTFTASANAALQPQFDTDAFKQKLVGQSVSALRPFVEGVPELADARVSLWPFWLTWLPKSPDKITIIVQ